MLKYVIALTGLAFLLAPAPMLAGTVSVEGKGDPALYVVKVHADWCGSCTALAPILKEVQAEVADQPVLFIQLDVTDPALTSQARLLAAALDLEDHFKANNKTGLVLLINAQDRALLETVTTQNSAAEIVGKIKTHLAVQAKQAEAAK